MFNETMRVVMNVWDNDGKVRINQNLDVIKAKYELDAYVKDVIKIGDEDYALILVKGSARRLKGFAQCTWNRVIRSKTTGKSYLMVMAL